MTAHDRCSHRNLIKCSSGNLQHDGMSATIQIAGTSAHVGGPTREST